MAEFEPAFDNTMKFEDPGLTGEVTVDAGGRTRFGIAEKFHPDLPDEFFTGDKDKALAIAEARMQEDYWYAGGFARIDSQDVANKLFDMAVNMGVHQAAIYAQRAVNATVQRSLVEDGAMGPKTAATINALDPRKYYQLLCEFSVQHYRHVVSVNPAQAVNLNGWLKRANA